MTAPFSVRATVNIDTVQNVLYPRYTWTTISRPGNPTAMQCIHLLKHIFSNQNKLHIVLSFCINLLWTYLTWFSLKTLIVLKLKNITKYLILILVVFCIILIYGFHESIVHTKCSKKFSNACSSELFWTSHIIGNIACYKSHGIFSYIWETWQDSILKKKKI